MTYRACLQIQAHLWRWGASTSTYAFWGDMFQPITLPVAFCSISTKLLVPACTWLGVRGAPCPWAWLLLGAESRWGWTGSSMQCECWNQVLVLSELWNIIFIDFHWAFNLLWPNALENTWTGLGGSHVLWTSYCSCNAKEMKEHATFLKPCSQPLSPPRPPLAPSFPSQVNWKFYF